MSQNETNLKVEEAWFVYQNKLLAFIRSKVETLEDAQDILNDVFVKLLKTVEDNAIPTDLSSWLYQVTKNRIIDYYRTRKKLELLPDDIWQESEESSVVKQLSKCMLPMIQDLPENYRHPLTLSEIQGKKYPEVAFELGMSVSAVKSRILRGREKLLKSMLACCTIYQNDKGETADYEKNLGSPCSGCDN